MNFLLGILEGGGSVDEHPLIQQLLDLFWLLMEVQTQDGQAVTHCDHVAFRHHHLQNASVCLSVLRTMK